MHYLHKILVYLPDALGEIEGTTREEMISAARNHAENATECYYEEAYDWRETDSAGRWSHEYPEGVILSREGIDKFVEELEGCKKSQQFEIQFALSELKKSIGLDLEKIAAVLWDQNEYGAEGSPFDMMAAFYLYSLACHLHGNYNCDSYFYDTQSCTARLYNDKLEKIKNTPDDWALVMFDYHN